MQDQYTGQAGTFVVDPVNGVRVPLEQYTEQKAAKETADNAAPGNVYKPVKPALTKESSNAISE